MERTISVRENNNINYLQPYKFLHASSGIHTGASSECLLEFDAPSNPLSHNGRFFREPIIYVT